jgi:serine/threonine protein kinase
LGAFEILAPIGAGGMGEVYKAKDTRLERIVAIKVLPEHLAQNPERKQRFEREAKAISQLNHPHICTLYDIGRDNEIDFLVMEYIEGQTLAERLKKGALPLDQALEYGSQIADGLDKAHRAGIVHRDLKPPNVILTPSGVKLLDFGLAKFTDRGASVGDTSDAPTQQKGLTDEHTLLGTLQYMAPEQLESKSVDTRTDIFALGALLYEMVTGTKAFNGESQASLIGAILKDDPPPLDRFQPMTSRMLDHVVRRCLEKDPYARWQAASDVMHELDWLRSTPAVEASAISSTDSHRLGRIVWLLAGAVIASTGVWLMMSSSAPEAPQVVRSVIPLEDNQTYALSFVPNLALSPDGKRLAHVVKVGTANFGTPYVRELDQLQATPIPGTDGARNPFFSPDGRWMGFQAQDGSLSKVALSGGAAVKLHPQGGRGASWGPDGEIVFTMGNRLGLWRISAEGGEPEPLTTPDRERGEKTHRFPDVLPDGSAVIFTIGTADIETFDDARIAVLSLETGAQKVLIEGGSQARFVPPRHLVYARAGSLLAIPFDAKRLEVTGSPTVVVDDVLMSPSYGHAEFSVSRNGSLAWVPGGARGINRRVAWVDRNGVTETIMDGTRAAMVRVSPDGERLAIWMEGANDNVWIYELARGTMSPLTMDWDAAEPIWTPDGNNITFSWGRDDLPGIFSRAADGSGEIELVATASSGPIVPVSWSPDGRFLVYNTETAENRLDDLWVLPLEGDRTPRPLIEGAAVERQAAVSLDGRWVAYTSDESGRDEVYVQPFPDGGGRSQVSSDGGASPTWSRDGRELFFLGGPSGQNVVAVTVTPASATFRASVPRILFEFPFARTAAQRKYDVAPDGRFVVIEAQASEVAPREIYLATNWATELNRLVPADR